MAATDDRSTDASAAPVAAALADAEFVHLVARADGDAVAAAGLLGRALASRGVPYQASAARTDAGAAARLEADDDAVTRVAVGVDAPAEAALDGPTVSGAAFETARRLGAGDPELALAGVHAAGGYPEADAPDVLEAADAARRPGVGVPTADLADGLAHSTLFHASFSGDAQAAGAALAELDLPAEQDDDARRRLASFVALDAPGGADAHVRALRPLAPGGPFETVAGYADVLEATARSAPGLALALALGHADRADALDAWRDHANAAHRAVARADLARHAGLVAVDAGDAAVATVARLVLAFRSPEPRVLALGDGEVALAGPDARETLARAVADAGDVGGYGPACARVDDAGAAVAAVREAMR